MEGLIHKELEFILGLPFGYSLPDMQPSLLPFNSHIYIANSFFPLTLSSLIFSVTPTLVKPFKSFLYFFLPSSLPPSILPSFLSSFLSLSLFPSLSFLPSFIFFLGLHLGHMEVPRPGVQSEQHLPTYTTATATEMPESFGNATSLTLWVRPGIKLKSSQTLHWDLNLLSHNGNSPHQTTENDNFSHHGGMIEPVFPVVFFLLF